MEHASTLYVVLIHIRIPRAARSTLKSPRPLHDD